MPNRYTRKTDNRVHNFERLRCPKCGYGGFRSVARDDALRACRACGLVFNLELEGVRPIAASRAKPRTASGSGVIAGRLLIRGYRF